MQSNYVFLFRDAEDIHFSKERLSVKKRLTEKTEFKLCSISWRLMDRSRVYVHFSQVYLSILATALACGIRIDSETTYGKIPFFP